MYRVEVKHAFGMFLRKTQKEIKDTFPDGESKAVENHYLLEKGKEVEEEIRKAAINESEGMTGQLAFQVRMIQEDDSKEIKVHYILDKGDKVDEEVKKNAINESEGIMGQLTFQVRMIQEDNSKEINLKAFAYHDWAEPANPPAKKEWGMLEMPMLTQSSYCILGGKFQKRKI